MKYESVQQAREALKKLEQTQAAYNHALGVLYLDATTAAPSDTWEGRGKTMEVMSQITYDLLVNDENDELLSYLEAHADELDAQTKREVEVLRKSYDQIHRIPAEEYVAYSVLINDAESVWHKAKPEDDFAAFAPYLEKIVDYNRKFAGYYHPEMAPYDALLNEYEEGMNVETLDAFFAQLRQTIVPLIEKIRATKQIDDAFLYRHYPVEIQRKLSDYLMEVMGIDRTHCGIAETEHPFTTNFTTRMCALPPIILRTIWFPPCSPSFTKAATPCMSWGRTTATITLPSPAACPWAFTRARAGSMRTSSAEVPPMSTPFSRS